MLEESGRLIENAKIFIKYVETVISKRHIQTKEIKKCYKERYLLGTEPEGMILHNTVFCWGPYSFKMCILDLAKIQLNCIGEVQICPGKKIYELPNNIYF